MLLLLLASQRGSVSLPTHLALRRLMLRRPKPRAVQRVKQQLVAPVVQRLGSQRDLAWLPELLVGQRRRRAVREHRRRYLLLLGYQTWMLSFRMDLTVACPFRTRPLFLLVMCFACKYRVGSGACYRPRRCTELRPGCFLVLFESALGQFGRGC